MVVDDKFVSLFEIGSKTDITEFREWTYIEFPIELAHIVDNSGMHLVSWLNHSLLKDDWVYRNRMFSFKHSRDATLFALKWM